MGERDRCGRMDSPAAAWHAGWLVAIRHQSGRSRSGTASGMVLSLLSPCLHRTHPNKSLQTILQQQGMSETDIRNFVNDLRDQENVARAQVGSPGDNMGIMETTVEKLRQNMENLGVEPWDF